MFNAADGDIRYFSDMIRSMPKQRARLYLPAIKVAFERLQALHRELLNLENTCHRYMKLLKMHLHIEVNNEARDNNKAARQTSEAVRQTSETSRQISESSRQISEAVRQTSETSRQNGLATMFMLMVS
jgi:methyl-accepting chemotaxis protein